MEVAISMMIKLVSMIKLVIVMKGVEDCLLVNIYAPKKDPENKMPVMVWIHGGSLITGSNRCSQYCGHFLCYTRNLFELHATFSDDLTNSSVRFDRMK